MDRLANVTCECLSDLGLMEALSLPRPKVEAYFSALGAGYTDVPYHNIEHIVDVVRLCTVIWKNGLGAKVNSAAPDNHDVLACAFISAAAGHDYEHPGLTNDFLIRTCHPFAVAHK